MSTNNSRCFLFEPCFSLSTDSAESFGRVITLFDDRFSRTSIFKDGQIGEDILQRLGDFEFSPEDDYVVASGDFLSVLVFVATVSAKYGNLNVLGWNGKKQRYESITIEEQQI